MLVNDLTFEKLKRNSLHCTLIRECFDFSLEFQNQIILFIYFFNKKFFCYFVISEKKCEMIGFHQFDVKLFGLPRSIEAYL